MLYYSEILNKNFNTEQECVDAEKDFKKIQEDKEKLVAERKARACEVEEARKNLEKAYEDYRNLLNNFLRDYKTYHYSTSEIKNIPTIFDDLFGSIFINW